MPSKLSSSSTVVQVGVWGEGGELVLREKEKRGELFVKEVEIDRREKKNLSSFLSLSLSLSPVSPLTLELLQLLGRLGDHGGLLGLSFFYWNEWEERREVRERKEKKKGNRCFDRQPSLEGKRLVLFLLHEHFDLF